MLQGHYGKTNNEGEARKLFKFAASNSSVEWGLNGFTGNRWVVGTLHKNSQAPILTKLDGLSIESMIYDAHSHPDATIKDFRPSGQDISIRNNSPGVKFELFMPKNPKQKWLEY